MKIIPILVLFISMGFSSPENALDMHSNVVAQVLIDNYHNDLYAEVYLEKSLLTMALKKEENCLPQEMLSICGNTYLQKHLSLSLNGSPLAFENQSQDIQKDFVIYRYFLGSAKEAINKIEVESDYMQKYNDHSVTKIRIKIDELEKHYSLRSEMQKITLSLN